jgi:hypothetical protein
VKTLPGPARAVRRTGEAASNVAVQREGQSMPVGLLVTLPGPETVTRRFAEPDAVARTGTAVQPRSKNTTQAVAVRGRRCSAAEM